MFVVFASFVKGRPRSEPHRVHTVIYDANSMFAIFVGSPQGGPKVGNVWFYAGHSAILTVYWGRQGGVFLGSAAFDVICGALVKRVFS